MSDTTYNSLNSVSIKTTGTHNTTWSGAYSPARTNNVTWTKVGSIVTLFFPFLSATADATTTLSMETVLPVALRPARNFNGLMGIIHNGRIVGALTVLTTGGITVYGNAAAGNFDTGQTAGFDNQPFTYFLD